MATTGTGDPNAFAGGFARFSFRFKVAKLVNFSLSGFPNPDDSSNQVVVLLEADGDTLFMRDTSGGFSTGGQLLSAFTYTPFGPARASSRLPEQAV